MKGKIVFQINDVLILINVNVLILDPNSGSNIKALESNPESDNHTEKSKQL